MGTVRPVAELSKCKGSQPFSRKGHVHAWVRPSFMRASIQDFGRKVARYDALGESISGYDNDEVPVSMGYYELVSLLTEHLFT